MPADLLKSELSGASPSVLIIDDEFTSRIILERVVKNIHANVEVTTFADPVAALAWLGHHQPDLILVDYLMDQLSGLEVIARIRRTPHLEDVPVVMVTVAYEKQTRYQVLDAGATDFISKPIDPYECRVRCRNLLSLRLHQKVVHGRARSLEQAVIAATAQIEERERETLYRLAKAGEYRDSDTGNHVLRMAKYARLIAESLGLAKERCELIEIAAPMHDIGKIGIPDNILLKPGKLTPEEYAVMQQHPLIGHRMLHDSRSKFIVLAAEISLGHHEKFDGSGYPNGLAGKDIPLESRIVAVADVFDALTSVRPYKSAWSNDHALEYLLTHKDAHFDPDCVDAFVAQYSKVLLVQQQLIDNIRAPGMQAVK
ncbi:HD domain-containing phosphohydrolase [Ferrigenium sp. UT5]|uniref:HD domain-containing phosphohydrolase n=1 Tax=Ferrigenium sp. UT5 TaxID=3242105 RepID=UPI003551D743